MDADRHAAIDQWMKGVKSKILLEVNRMVYAAAVSLQPPKSPESKLEKRRRGGKSLKFWQLISWLDVEIKMRRSKVAATLR